MYYKMYYVTFKATQMGPLFVLVCPCFKENVIVTCKIGSFLCRLDDFLLKNVIIFFFGNQISKWRSFEKKCYFWPTFHIFGHQGKDTKNPSAHISHTYTYFAHLIDVFALQILQKLRIYHVWFLFGVIPGVDSFCAILEQSINNKMVRKG